MSKILINNAWAIFDIGERNKADVGVAMDMFAANLNNFGIEGAEFYPGAEVDYAALSAEWKAMTSDERAAAKLLYSAATRKLYSELTALRRAGDEEGFNALLAAYALPAEGAAGEAE